MPKRMIRCGLCFASLALALPAYAQPAAKHVMTFDDMIKLHRISGAAISQDGKWVAYSVSTPDLEANRSVSNIWIVSTSGGDPIQVSQGGRDSSPRWSPDGKTLAFLSARDGNSQIYLLSMEGGEAKKLTQLSTGRGFVSLVARRKNHRVYVFRLSGLPRRRLATPNAIGERQK